jgi:hypothetical protein
MARRQCCRQYCRHYGGTTRVHQGIQAEHSLPAKQHWHASQYAPCKGCQHCKRPKEIVSKGNKSDFRAGLNKATFHSSRKITEVNNRDGMLFLQTKLNNKLILKLK